MSGKLMVAMSFSVISILMLIWQQDQMTIFFGSYPSVASIFFVAVGGAVAALCVDESSSDLLVIALKRLHQGQYWLQSRLR